MLMIHLHQKKMFLRHYELDLIDFNEIKKSFYDCILVAVAHDQFINLDLKQFTKSKESLIYDLKGIYNNKEFRRL